MSSLLDARAKAENVIFREDFVNSTTVESHGGVLTAAPAIANGVLLNGTSQYVTYPKIQPTDEMTIMIDVSGATSVSGGKAIFGQYEASNYMWAITIDERDIGCYVSNNGASSSLRASGYLLTSARTHLAFVVNNVAKTWKLYVNGVYDSTMTSGYSYAQTDSDLTVGSIAGGAFFTGTIHSADVLQGQLSADEILDYYNDSTFKDIDDSQAAIALPLKSFYNNGTKDVTENVGDSACVALWGNGSTSTTYPTLLAPGGMSCGNSDHINCGTCVSAVTELSVSMLVKPTAAANMRPWSIFSTNGTSTALGIYSPTNLGYRILYNTGSSFTDTGVLYTIGAYQHIILTTTIAGAASKMNFYVNGVLESTDTIEIDDLDGDLTFSKLVNSWQGEIWFPRVYKKVLTPTQVRYITARDYRMLNKGA